MKSRAVKILIFVSLLLLCTGSTLYAFVPLQQTDREIYLQAAARKPAEPLRGGQQQYSSPRYELAGHYSLGSRSRSRSSELCGLDESDWVAGSAVDRKLLKDAETASRNAFKHALKSYIALTVREITEGGKNETREVAFFSESRDALRPILPL